MHSAKSVRPSKYMETSRLFVVCACSLLLWCQTCQHVRANRSCARCLSVKLAGLSLVVLRVCSLRPGHCRESYCID